MTGPIAPDALLREAVADTLAKHIRVADDPDWAALCTCRVGGEVNALDEAPAWHRRHQADAVLAVVGAWQDAEIVHAWRHVDEAVSERDEARATKDMHKERADDLDYRIARALALLDDADALDLDLRAILTGADRKEQR